MKKVSKTSLSEEGPHKRGSFRDSGHYSKMEEDQVAQVQKDCQCKIYTEVIYHHDNARNTSFKVVALVGLSLLLSIASFWLGRMTAPKNEISSVIPTDQPNNKTAEKFQGGCLQPNHTVGSGNSNKEITDNETTTPTAYTVSTSSTTESDKTQNSATLTINVTDEQDVYTIEKHNSTVKPNFDKKQRCNFWSSCKSYSPKDPTDICIFVEVYDKHEDDLAKYMNSTELLKCNTSKGRCTRKCCNDCCDTEKYSGEGTICLFKNCTSNSSEPLERHLVMNAIMVTLKCNFSDSDRFSN